MKKSISSFITMLFLVLYSCEEIKVTSPFSIQDTNAEPPRGSFEWDIEFKSAEAGDIGKLDENTGCWYYNWYNKCY